MSGWATLLDFVLLSDIAMIILKWLEHSIYEYFRRPISKETCSLRIHVRTVVKV